MRVALLLTAALALSAAGPVQIVTTGVPTGAVTGTPFSYTWTATGGTTPYKWSIASGALPTGLAFSGTGVLSGTPTALGSFSFTVHVADSGNLSADFATKMTITAPPLTITSAPLTSGTLNFPLTLQLTGAGGVPPYFWRLGGGGTFPAESYLTPTALFSGVWTLTSSGSYNLAFNLTDSVGNTTTQTESVTIALPTVLPPGVVGKAYSTSVPAGATLASGTRGGPPPGILVTLNGLAGIPTTAGSWLFSLGTTTYSMIVTAPLVPTTTNPPDGTIGVSYDGFLPANGGTVPFTWSLTSGSLPPGLALATSGHITGTPTSTGASAFTATVTDATGATAVSQFSLNIDGPALQISETPIVLGTGIPASTALIAVGGTSPDQYWTASGLPPGTVLYPGGDIVGTPTASGSYTIAAQVTNGAGATATGTIPLSVQNPVGLVSGLVGSPYSSPLNESSCTGTPPGLTLANSALAGTPFMPGRFYLYCSGPPISFPPGSGVDIFTLYILGSSTPRLDSVTNAASYVLNQIAPGEIVALYGADLGPPVLSGTQLSANGTSFSASNSGTVVTFDGNPVPIVYSLESQVAAVAPFGLKPGATTTIAVSYNGAPSNSLTVPVVAAQPGIFTMSGNGKGPAAAVNQDGTINAQYNPASPGSTVLLYVTGTGQISPAGVDGLIATAASSTIATPNVYVYASLPPKVLYAGNAPTLVEGATQVNVQLPPSIAAGATPLLLFFGNAQAQQAVTLWVR